jgi:hypothetical protein
MYFFTSVPQIFQNYLLSFNFNLYLTLNEDEFFLTVSTLTNIDNNPHQNLCISQNTDLINVHKFVLIHILDSECLKECTGNQFISCVN